MQRSILRPFGLLLLASGLLALDGCVDVRGKISPDVKLEIHRETALTYYESGDLDRAEDQALRGLAVDESDKTLQLILGWVNLQRGDSESLWKAEYVFEGMQDEEDFRVNLGLGETQERLGILHDQNGLAVERGDQLPTSRGSDGLEKDVKRLRGEAILRWNRAINEYKQVLRIEPEHVKGLNGLQRTWSLLGEYETSLGYTGQLIECLAFKLKETSSLLADPLDSLDVRAQARLRELVRDNRQLLLDTHLFAHSLELELDHPTRALAHLDEAIKLDASDVEVFSRRGQLRQRLGDPEGAIQDLSVFIGRSNLPFEDPDLQRAWQLRREAEAQIASR